MRRSMRSLDSTFVFCKHINMEQYACVVQTPELLLTPRIFLKQCSAISLFQFVQFCLDLSCYVLAESLADVWDAGGCVHDIYISSCRAYILDSVE